MIKIYSYNNMSSSDNSKWWDEQWFQYSMEDALAWTHLSEMTKLMNSYINKKDIVFEGGCGLGRLLVYFKEKNIKIFGSDWAIETLKRVKTFDPLLEVSSSDLRNLGIKNQEFSIYLSEGVIEHFKEGPELILKEAYRILKYKGKIIITVPAEHFFAFIYFKFFFYNNFLRKLFNKNSVKKTKFDYFLYNKKELRKFLEDSGFVIKKIYPVLHEAGLYRYFFFFRKKGVHEKIHIVGHTKECLNIFGRIFLLVKKVFPYMFNSCLLAVAEKSEK